MRGLFRVPTEILIAGRQLPAGIFGYLGERLDISHICICVYISARTVRREQWRWRDGENLNAKTMGRVSGGHFALKG